MGLLDDIARAGEFSSEICIDRGSDTVYERGYQDCEQVLKKNQAIRNDDVEPWFEDRSWVLAASIPLGIVHKWMVEDGINALDPADNAKVMAKLDDPEWDKLKTWGGKLSKRAVRTYVKAST